MLEGITVLATDTENIVSYNIGLDILLICLGLLFGIFISTLILEYTDLPDGLAIAPIMIIVVLSLYIAKTASKEVAGTYNIYKVTIDSSVSLQEFNELYEILDQDGLIYTIKEKEASTN